MRCSGRAAFKAKGWASTEIGPASDVEVPNPGARSVPPRRTVIAVRRMGCVKLTFLGSLSAFGLLGGAELFFKFRQAFASLLDSLRLGGA